MVFDKLILYWKTISYHCMIVRGSIEFQQATNFIWKRIKLINAEENPVALVKYWRVLYFYDKSSIHEGQHNQIKYSATVNMKQDEIGCN